jgi:hypothetical protein
MLVRSCRSDLSDFTKAENSSVFTKAENLSGFPKGENLSGFPKGEILSVLPKAEDLSVFPKPEGVPDFQVWDIGYVTVSNFDWLPFTPSSGRLLRSINWYQSRFGHQLALTGFVT